MGKNRLIIKADFSHYVNIIVNKLPAEYHVPKFRKVITDMLKRQYSRGYTKGVRDTVRSQYVISEMNDVDMVFDLQRENYMYVTSKNIDVIIRHMKEIGFEIYGIDRATYKSISRRKPIAEFHKAIFYVLHECGITYEVLGNTFTKDHSTIVTAVKMFNIFMQSDKEFRSKFITFINVLQQEFERQKFRLPLSVLIKAGLYDKKEIPRII